MALDIEFTFDEKTYRKRMNGFDVVGHSHNLLCLVIKMAEEYEEFDGIRIMAESVEDSVRPLFDDYVKRQGVSLGAARLQMAVEFYEIMGMGKMESSGTEKGGEVTLTRSHLDEGWKMKFGNADHPVNHWTRGFIAAMFASAFDKPARSYQVKETASLAQGHPQSVFSVRAA